MQLHIKLTVSCIELSDSKRHEIALTQRESRQHSSRDKILLQELFQLLH